MAKDTLTKVIVELAYLCDSMKRLEKAIDADSASDRFYYLEEAKERRERVEKNLEAMAKAEAPPHDHIWTDDPKAEAPPHDHIWTDDPKAPPNGFRICSVCGVSSKGMAE